MKFYLPLISKLKWGLTVLIFFDILFSQNVNLLFTGDVMLAHHVERFIQDRIKYPFARLKQFKEADLSIINLEAPFTTATRPREKPYVFKVRPDYVKILKLAGVDLVNLANNHIYDYGAEGLLQTLKILEENQIAYIGAGRNLMEARKPAVFEIKGLKLAFLGYYGLSAHEESHPATRKEPGTALRHLNFIKEDIQKLKGKVDFITAIFHWGQEKKHFPEKDQIGFAHKVIEYGANLVVGHHPHVLQGIEKYRSGIIVYSLGDFIFGGNGRIYKESAMLHVTIPTQYIENWSIEMIPIGIKYWQPFILTGIRRDTVLTNLKKYSKIFEQTPLQ